MAEITLPTNFLDWKSKQLNLPSSVGFKKHGNSAGRREWPLLVDEPNYVIVRNDEAIPRLLGIHKKTQKNNKFSHRNCCLLFVLFPIHWLL